MIIAVVGCAHGELDLIYETIHRIEEANHIKVDLLICCGDFQSVRFPEDNAYMNIKKKYLKKDCDFMHYYYGEKSAKILTVFTGGNHEAVNVLKELYYGGWVAPNIFYLGHSGVYNIGELRIASVSGIYKKYNAERTYVKGCPFSESEKISEYHMRKYEVEKLKLVKEPIDIMITHDWPNNIEKSGNVKKLIKQKKFFKEEILTGTLGNPMTEELLKLVQPHFWFAGHLHVKFAAVYSHENSQRNTKFLALNKAQVGRDFLQILHIEKKSDTLLLKEIKVRETLKPSEENEVDAKCTSMELQTNDMKPYKENSICENKNKESKMKDIENHCSSNSANGNSRTNVFIYYDLEWLGIVKANHHFIDINSTNNYNQQSLVYPSKEDFDFIKNKLKQTQKKVEMNNETFFPVPGYNNYPSYKNLYDQRNYFLNQLDLEELSMYGPKKD